MPRVESLSGYSAGIVVDAEIEGVRSRVIFRCDLDLCGDVVRAGREGAGQPLLGPVGSLCLGTVTRVAVPAPVRTVLVPSNVIGDLGKTGVFRVVASDQRAAVLRT